MDDILKCASDARSSLSPNSERRKCGDRLELTLPRAGPIEAPRRNLIATTNGSIALRQALAGQPEVIPLFPFASPLVPSLSAMRQHPIATLASLAAVAFLALALALGLSGAGSTARAPALLAVAFTPEPVPDRHHSRHRPRSPAPTDRQVPGAPPPAAQVEPVVAPPLLVSDPPALPGSLAAASGSSRTGGDGFGSGNGSGNASGAVGGGLPATPAEQVAGHLSPHDLPAGSLPPGGEVSVRVAYTVGVDGLVHECAVERSSGDATIDLRVCTLLVRRFRYRPARDPEGKLIASVVRETHSWARKPDPGHSPESAATSGGNASP